MGVCFRLLGIWEHFGVFVVEPGRRRITLHFDVGEASRRAIYFGGVGATGLAATAEEEEKEEEYSEKKDGASDTADDDASDSAAGKATGTG